MLYAFLFIGRMLMLVMEIKKSSKGSFLHTEFNFESLAFMDKHCLLTVTPMIIA